MVTIGRKKLDEFFIFIVRSHFSRHSSKDQPITNWFDYLSSDWSFFLFWCRDKRKYSYQFIAIKKRIQYQLFIRLYSVLFSLLSIHRIQYMLLVTLAKHKWKECSIEKGLVLFCLLSLVWAASTFSNRFNVRPNWKDDRKKKEKSTTTERNVNNSKSKEEEKNQHDMNHIIPYMVCWRRFIYSQHWHQVCFWDVCMYDEIITRQWHQRKSTHDRVGEMASKFIWLNERQTNNKQYGKKQSTLCILCIIIYYTYILFKPKKNSICFIN